MSSTDTNGDDPSFLALPARLRHRIDSAFNSTASSVAQLDESNASAAGGFIVEESESGPSRSAAYEPGGFIVDLPSNTFDAQPYIPLSEIHHALNLLDLSPDGDIMGVFENAAAGWGAQHAPSDGVSRKDWRAICTALLEGEHVDGGDEESPVADEDFEMDSGPDSDEYQTEQLSSEAEEASSDEYSEPSRTGTRTSKRAQKATPTNPAKSPVMEQLTESQKARCRQDFSRFFLGVPDSELDSRRIMIQDVVRVAGLLKENLKTEEILEMLGAFSSSPDKSMNLADFERMMIHTKLV